MLELKVCIGSACHVRGSYNVIQAFQQLIEENCLHDRVRIRAVFCMQQCQADVSVSIGDEVYSVRPEAAREFFRTRVLPLLAENK